MGKIRVKTIGSEEQEQVDAKKAKARAEAKKAREAAAVASEVPGEKEEKAKEKKAEAAEAEATPEKKDKKSAKYLKTKKTTEKHSKAYKTVAAKVQKEKKYKLADAVALLPELQRAKFDETVELHINTVEKGISGNVTLPHGTGKQTKVVIANQTTDAQGVEDLVKQIEAGQIDFDVLIATPDAMPKLARVARVLGPRGLMPNPKNGTVTPKPEDAAKKFAGGQMNFKTEAKFPLLHLTVGKVSFGDKKLSENIKSAVAAVKTKNIKTVVLKATMSPGIKLDTGSL
jgi:large subunit ribosomal protein L1